MPSDGGEYSDWIYRFTDFLVYEVDQDSNVIHLKDIGMPSSQRKKTEEVKAPEETSEDAPLGEPTSTATEEAKPTESESTPEAPAPVEAVVETSSLDSEAKPEEKTEDKPEPGASSKGKEKAEPWPESFDSSLKPFLSEDVIARVKNLFL